MNTIDTATASLVDWVDFKWLMAGEGHVVNLDRLQGDAAYAGSCVSQALQSPQRALRLLALKLQRRVGNTA